MHTVAELKRRLAKACERVRYLAPFVHKAHRHTGKWTDCEGCTVEKEVGALADGVTEVAPEVMYRYVVAVPGLVAEFEYQSWREAVVALHVLDRTRVYYPGVGPTPLSVNGVPLNKELRWALRDATTDEDGYVSEPTAETWRELGVTFPAEG